MPAKGVKTSLAFLALQERRPDVLKLCLDEGGFPYEAYFIIEADELDEKKDPETFAVLEQSRFRRLMPRKPPGEVKSDNPAAVFDRGGKFPVEW